MLVATVNYGAVSCCRLDPQRVLFQRVSLQSQVLLEASEVDPGGRKLCHGGMLIKGTPSSPVSLSVSFSLCFSLCASPPPSNFFHLSPSLSLSFLPGHHDVGNCTVTPHSLHPPLPLTPPNTPSHTCSLHQSQSNKTSQPWTEPFETVNQNNPFPSFKLIASGIWL